VKQHLDALRMLFDWLVIGQVNQLNPVHAVHGPKYVVKKGKTSVLTVDEARKLLDSIPLVLNTGRRLPAASACYACYAILRAEHSLTLNPAIVPWNSRKLADSSLD